MSVFLGILLMVTAATALASVRAAVAARRLNKGDRAERQPLAARRPETVNTYAHDESGALISVKTSPVTLPDGQTLRRAWKSYSYDNRGVETGVEVHCRPIDWS